ncbi:leucine repeat-rich domain-containing protein [Encephalitozoon hellem]|uniref:Leucine repeat-rich domain-containing protein n=2 Tax=Encephalitozoon hellem TaxID=27973 RepID=A0ABY8CKM9_ENCHE|nr:leucine repeat-rich domain-containing protein [Encephalitozoon hellem]
MQLLIEIKHLLYLLCGPFGRRRRMKYSECVSALMGDTVYIVHRQLERIPTIPGDAKTVDLRRNNISRMALNRAELVEYLDLSDNRIKVISDLENLPRLKVLDLSYNLISDISIPRMGIEELYLISNDISAIHGLDLPRIKKLDMAVNDICRIENLESCIALEELYLGSNRIRIVEGLERLTSLRVLDLQNNEIEAVDCSMIPSSVEVLLLGENRDLRALENIEHLPRLRILGLEKTSISEGIARDGLTVWR